MSKRRLALTSVWRHATWRVSNVVPSSLTWHVLFLCFETNVQSYIMRSGRHVVSRYTYIVVPTVHSTRRAAPLDLWVLPIAPCTGGIAENTGASRPFNSPAVITDYTMYKPKKNQYLPSNSSTQLTVLMFFFQCSVPCILLCNFSNLRYVGNE